MSYYTPDQFGELLSECWCLRACVMVPVQHVRDGLTRSCGHPACVPPATPDTTPNDDIREIHARGLSTDISPQSTDRPKGYPR